MKKLIFMLTLFTAFALNSLEAEVNGALQNVNDRFVLHVWGTHYERGYATGYLMASNIMDLFRNYIFSSVASNNVNSYNYDLHYYQDHFITDARYVSEMEGIIAGMQDSGVDMYHIPLARNVAVQDLYYVNAVVDLSIAANKNAEFGCSSISSWGAATMDDPNLNGALQITRQLDWNRNMTLIANPLMVIHHPSEPDEQKWISLTYPGLIGALSAISISKSAAFMNVGSVHANTNDSDYTSVLLDIRSGIERSDFNSDGVHSTEDVFAALETGNHISGSIIHNVQQWADSTRAYIVETNNGGTVRRGHNEASNIAGDNLAATNHFRLLHPPQYCNRYVKIIDSLAVSPYVNEDRQWRLLKGAGGVQSNLMMMQYIPNQNELRWSVATPYYAAHTQVPIVYDTQLLFTLPTSNADLQNGIPADRLCLYPNPLHKGQKLASNSAVDVLQYCLYNLKGQLLFTGDSLPNSEIFPTPAVYILQAKKRDGTKISAKVMYIN